MPATRIRKVACRDCDIAQPSDSPYSRRRNSVREPLAVLGLTVAGLLYAAEELEHAKAARRWPR